VPSLFKVFAFIAIALKNSTPGEIANRKSYTDTTDIPANSSPGDEIGSSLYYIPQAAMKVYAEQETQWYMYGNRALRSLISSILPPIAC